MSSASSVYRRLALHLQNFAFFTSLTPILVLGIGLVRSSTYAYPMSICRLLPRLSARQHGFTSSPSPSPRRVSWHRFKGDLDGSGIKLILYHAHTRTYIFTHIYRFILIDTCYVCVCIGKGRETDIFGW